MHRRVGAGRAPPLQGWEEFINHKTWLSAKSRLAEEAPAPRSVRRRLPGCRGGCARRRGSAGCALYRRQRAWQRCRDFSTPARSTAYHYFASRTRKCITELAPGGRLPSRVGRRSLIIRLGCLSSRRQDETHRRGTGASPPGAQGAVKGH